LSVQDAIKSSNPKEALNKVFKAFNQIVSDSEDEFDALFENFVASLEKRQGEVAVSRFTSTWTKRLT